MFELFVLAIAPALFILWYIYNKDSYESEPLRLVLWVFFLGVLSVIPAAILEYPFPPGIFTSSVVAPVVEECVKFSVVFFAVYRHGEFDEPMDGIVYAAAAGLGFATLENIFYVLEGGVAVGIIRAVASVPAHVIFSCVWGFALGTAKFRNKSARPAMIATGLAGAMFLHGIFNFSLEFFEVFGFLLIIVVLLPLGWWMTKRNIRTAHADAASACSGMTQASTGGLTAPADYVRHESGSAAFTDRYPPAVPDRRGVTIRNDLKPEQTVAAHFCTHCGAYCPEGMRFCGQCGKKLK